MITARARYCYISNYKTKKKHLKFIDRANKKYGKTQTKHTERRSKEEYKVKRKKNSRWHTATVHATHRTHFRKQISIEKIYWPGCKWILISTSYLHITQLRFFFFFRCSFAFSISASFEFDSDRWRRKAYWTYRW